MGESAPVSSTRIPKYSALSKRRGIWSDEPDSQGAASIPANIAEGAGRETQLELAHFLSIASGSAAELDYHLLLARDLGYMDSHDYQELENCLAEIKRMLYGFKKTVKSNLEKQ